MSVSLAADIQQLGDSGPLSEPCSRGMGSPQPQTPKDGSPQPQNTKDGTGERLEPEDGALHDAQVRHPGREEGETRERGG